MKYLFSYPLSATFILMESEFTGLHDWTTEQVSVGKWWAKLLMLHTNEFWWEIKHRHYVSSGS